MVIKVINADRGIQLDERPVTGECPPAAGFCASQKNAGTEAPAMDTAAMRNDPRYRRFVAVLALIVYQAMEREGTMPERWRRPLGEPGPRRGDARRNE